MIIDIDFSGHNGMICDMLLANTYLTVRLLVIIITSSILSEENDKNYIIPVMPL